MSRKRKAVEDQNIVYPQQKKTSSPSTQYPISQRYPLYYQSVFTLTFDGCILGHIDSNVAAFRCLPENLATANLSHLLPGRKISMGLLVSRQIFFTSLLLICFHRFGRKRKDDIVSDLSRIWDVKVEQVTDLLVFIGCCSKYTNMGVAYSQAARILAPLWYNLWVATPGQKGLQTRTKLCLLAMQHPPVSVVILSLLAWSAVFDSPENLLEFIVRYSLPQR